MYIKVNRKDIRFNPDPTRIITRFFQPGGPERVLSIIERVLSLSDDDVNITLNQVLRNFSKRHRNITKIFEETKKKLISSFQG